MFPLRARRARPTKKSPKPSSAPFRQAASRHGWALRPSWRPNSSAMQVEPISYHVEARVAVARIDNPPVNALGPGVRHGLMKAIQAASADPQVAALILTGSGNAFVGGADIRE